MEEAALQAFLPAQAKDAAGAGGGAKRTFGDVLLQALSAHQHAKEEVVSGATKNPAVANDAVEGGVATNPGTKQLSPRVLEVYSEVAKFLAAYKSGKLPKPFLVIPSLGNWEEMLCLCKPLDWTPNAMREATKMFASQLNARRAQRFYNLVLLPAVRQNLADYDRLNFHYYESLKKAMFKPAAYMKGILLPILRDCCTLKEAHIMATVLAKISVPVLHASAVLLKLAAEPQWYGTTALIMTALIGKRYSLPRSVVNTLINHYYSFVEDERELPLVWHRGLLVFLQRYKKELGVEGRAKMKQLLKIHSHPGIGPECRRELLTGGGLGEC